MNLAKTIDQKINIDARLKSRDDIGDAVSHFIENIQSAAWNASTKTQKHSSNSLLIPNHILELIAQWRVRSRWQRTK